MSFEFISTIDTYRICIDWLNETVDISCLVFNFDELDELIKQLNIIKVKIDG